MKALTILLTTLLINSLSSVDALYAFTISKRKYSQWDVADNPSGWTWISGDYSVFDVINLVNSYLRFAVWFVCFVFMIVNGYKLITAHGDEKKTGAATKWLLWAIIWIVICLLAYIIVNLAVKLFA